MMAGKAVVNVAMVSYGMAALFLALFVVRIVSPAFVLLATLSLIFIRPPTSSPPPEITSVIVASRVPRRAAILVLLSLCSITFFADGVNFVVHAVLNKVWPRWSGIEFNAIIGVAAFSGLAALGSWKELNGCEVWFRKRVTTAIAAALVLDIAHVVLFGLSIKEFNDFPPPHIPESHPSIPLFLLLQLVFPAFRVLLLLPLFFVLLYPRVVYRTVQISDDTNDIAPTQSSLLLPPEIGVDASSGLTANHDNSKYGTFGNTASRATTRPQTPATSQSPSLAQKSEVKTPSGLDAPWSEISKRIVRLLPYLWPYKSVVLQLLALLCMVILFFQRFVNVSVPFVLGALIKVLEEGSTRSPWPYLFAYVVLRFFQSSLNPIRSILWAPVMQYSDREMSQMSFDHLLNLSFAWHTRRKTGEVLRILDRGASINQIFELILFNVTPTFFDIIIALVVFVLKFGWTLALVIFCVMAAYVVASVILTKWRTKIRRQANDRDIITRGIHTDCLLNYETVKYFNGEAHESQRYRNAIGAFQVMEYKVILSLNLLNLVQGLIISVGVLAGSMLVAWRVTQGVSTPSDFVIFITYLSQLYVPLNNLGYIYRSLNSSFVDAERLLNLLNEPTEVNDKPNAPDLAVEQGHIVFDNVSFSYDGRGTSLNSISFQVPKGSSVALVGESGAGKSTILRLLYRFYDLREGEGRILIDGQDITGVTQSSLRQAIGVVPQDCALFNANISFNIGYGRQGASQEEIQAAARAAQMHDRIMSFPDGYDTIVGERGVRLSGGERQRIAIARTLLKNPPILLLDEATSALDTSTEKDIQKALHNLMEGRSSLTIAHRLSTIATADLILVLKDGKIVEKGSFKELLASSGVFASMWAEQITTTETDELENKEATKEEATSGYAVDDGEPISKGIAKEGTDATAVEIAAEASAPVVSEDILEAPAAAPEAIETSVTDGKADEPTEATVHVAFPTAAEEAPPTVPEKDAAASDEPAAEPAASPLAFPTTEDSASQQAPSEAATHGVTFGDANVPERTGTPDPGSEPKRKRISSQNFQRLARRISISGRRQGSTSSFPNLIPSLRRDSSATQVTKDEGESSARGSLDNMNPSGSSTPNESPAKGKKKEKKRKSVI